MKLGMTHKKNIVQNGLTTMVQSDSYCFSKYDEIFF